ncbi:MAG: hypothetical protein M3T96_06200 [Acidobacteriota bacterium]|nr:hypothetical protein [Acidobacteriota bacterium]
MSEKPDRQNTNIFEDLIDELKEENLIEETVTESYQAETAAAEREKSSSASETDSAETAETASAAEITFYRKRATEEVASLQTVESVFAGIERDQLKIVPMVYDDWEVKKVLHSFLHLPANTAANERAAAEFALVQATEKWYSTLAERDQQMMTAHLRRYCETSRPSLSAPALIALAKFYRNSPYLFST